MASNQLLRSLGEALGSGALVKELLYHGLFAVDAEGAVGDGVTDDSEALEKATTAAEAHGPGAAIYLTGGKTYLFQDPTTAAHAAASDGGIVVNGDLIDVIGYGATMKIGPRGLGTYAVRLFGNKCSCLGVKVDQNAKNALGVTDSTTALATKDNSGIEVNGGNDCLVADCTVYNGFKSLTTTDLTQGEDSFVCTGGDRVIFRNCRSVNSGWTGFKLGNCDSALLDGCWILEQRGHGIRCQGAMSTIHIVNCRSHSSICSGRSNIIIDPASSGSSARCTRAFISGVDCFTDPASDFGGGSSNCLKIASTVECFVESSRFDSADNGGAVCIRLEDCIRKITFSKCSFHGEVSYAPNSGDIWYGTLSNVNTDSSGFVTLTLPTSAVGVGKSIFVKGSGVPQYNREHIVTAKPTGTTYTTNVPFVAGTVGTAAYAHTMVDESRFIDCVFESELATGGTYNITNMFGRIMDFERCRFLNYTPSTAKMGAIDYNTPDTHLELLRFHDVEVIFNSDKVCKAVRPQDQGTVEAQTLLFTQAITSGNFTLTHNGNTTGAITFTTVVATLASNIQTALRLLTGLSAVTCAFTSGAFGSADVLFTVTFLGVPGNTPQMTSNAGGLSGGTPTITHATTVAGVAPTMLVQSGKTIGLRFNVTNLGGGSGLKADTNSTGDTGSPYPNRTTLFTSSQDRTGCYMATAAPTVGDVTWNVGDMFTNSAPSAGARPGWMVTTAGAPGTIQQMAALS